MDWEEYQLGKRGRGRKCWGNNKDFINGEENQVEGNFIHPWFEGVPAESRQPLPRGRLRVRHLVFEAGLGHVLRHHELQLRINNDDQQ